MDHSPPNDRDFEVDLESGGTYNEEEASDGHVSGAKKQAKMLFAKVCGGFVDGSTLGENGVSLCSPSTNGVPAENVVAVTDMNAEAAENVNSAEKKTVKEKRKKTSNKKAPKPPRPPRGPSLDAADKKLIKEISDLAMLKRARIERMKALKKMKIAKSSSSSNNLFAMVFTVLFCLVILFQGISSRASRPAADSVSGGTQDVLISVQYYGNPSPNDSRGPATGSPNLVEQVAGSDPQLRLQRFNR